MRFFKYMNPIIAVSGCVLIVACAEFEPAKIEGVIPVPKASEKASDSEETSEKNKNIELKVVDSKYSEFCDNPILMSGSENDEEIKLEDLVTGDDFVYSLHESRTFAQFKNSYKGDIKPLGPAGIMQIFGKGYGYIEVDESEKEEVKVPYGSEIICHNIKAAVKPTKEDSSENSDEGKTLESEKGENGPGYDVFFDMPNSIKASDGSIQFYRKDDLKILNGKSKPKTVIYRNDTKIGDYKGESLENVKLLVLRNIEDRNITIKIYTEYESNGSKVELWSEGIYKKKAL